MNVLDITVADGKYRVIQNKDGRVTAERYGGPWRDCVGDNLVLALAQEVESLREMVKGMINKDKLVTELVSRPDDLDGLIHKLDIKAQEHDKYDFGLPIHEVNYMFGMRMIILEWLKDL